MALPPDETSDDKKVEEKNDNVSQNAHFRERVGKVEDCLSRLVSALPTSHPKWMIVAVQLAQVPSFVGVCFVLALTRTSVSLFV